MVSFVGGGIVMVDGWTLRGGIEGVGPKGGKERGRRGKVK